MSASSRPAPVWHRLAREMAREGATLAEIVTEFEAPADVVASVVHGDLDEDERRVAARLIGREVRDAAIVAAYRAGEPVKDIVERWDIDQTRVSQIARAAGCAPRIRCNRVRGAP